MSKQEASKKIVVKQVGSPIRRMRVQAEHLKGLGLGKIGRVRELDDNAIVRGLIRKVAHMVTIIEQK